MRSPTLHAALRAFVEDASGRLADDTAHGAEVPFELVEEGGRRTPLYCYRPRVDEFLRTRATRLARLPSYAPAVRALGQHVDVLPRYLAARGEPALPHPPAVLEALLEHVHSETSDFAFDPVRFDRTYAQLEQALFAGRTDATVLVSVLGLDIASDEIVLGDGLALRRGETLPDAPAEAVGDDDVLALFRAVVEPGAPDPFGVAGRRFRRLLTALRLYDDGGIALGAVAWTRVDEGAWKPAVLGAGGVARGLCLVEAEEEDELRGFCNLVARRTPRSGELAWALGRYEMACERRSRSEALSDVLLALRALLEPEGPQSDLLAGRLATLCAVPEQRAAMAERATHAIALERAVVVGTAPRSEAVDALVDELVGHLRALLRDVLCGHLEVDVRALADRLAAEEGVPA